MRPTRASICRSAALGCGHRCAAPTTEVCVGRVWSAGSTICNIAKEFARRFQNLARSLQNLHRGFDSRRRLSSEQIARIRGPKAEVRQTSAARPVLATQIALAFWRGARQKSAAERQKSAGQRSAGLRGQSSHEGYITCPTRRRFAHQSSGEYAHAVQRKPQAAIDASYEL